jgi:hypothetical protein
VLERVLVTWGSDQLLDHRRVEDRAAVSDPLDASGQLVEVGDALLEQLADPVGTT